MKARMAEKGVSISNEMIVNGDLDATIRRFLRARKYNLENSFNLLASKCLQCCI